jgi:hypothetical protein
MLPDAPKPLLEPAVPEDPISLAEPMDEETPMRSVDAVLIP